jgi:hypothetical protein
MPSTEYVSVPTLPLCLRSLRTDRDKLTNDPNIKSLTWKLCLSWHIHQFFRDYPRGSKAGAAYIKISYRSPGIHEADHIVPGQESIFAIMHIVLVGSRRTIIVFAQ